MMFVTSLLFVIMTMYCGVHGQCDDLTITNDRGQQIDTSTVCLRMYITPECSPFYESFNQSELPIGYLNSTNTVDKPEDIALDGLNSPHGDYIYPGISIMWSNPFSGSGKASVNGYLIAWYDTNSSDVKCRLFQMQTGFTTKLHFKYNVPFVEQITNYMVRVYSMPPYQPQFKDDDRTFVYKYIKTCVAYDFKNPGNWGPSVMYSTLKNGTVSIIFTLPPAVFNMTSFTALLASETNLNAAVCKRNVTTESRTEINTQYVLNCTAKQSGFYHITVWVNDDYHMDPNRCLCYKHSENGTSENERDCNHLCGGTSTEPFYVNITEPPLQIQTTEPPLQIETTDPPVRTTTGPTTQTTISENITGLPTDPDTTWDGSNPDSLKYILGAVFAFFSLFIVLVGIFLFRRKEKVKKLIPFWRCFSYDMERDPFQPEKNACISPTEIQTSMALLPRKTVYLMSAGDHPAHVELVESFVAFLEVHCRCDVIIPSDSDQRDDGAYTWFLNSIRMSDFIIFFNSLGAHKLIEAHLTQKTYTNKVSTEDDIFNWGLKHIIVNADVRDKQLILVSFHGKHCQQFLQVHEIMLPMELPRLIRKIHRLTFETAKLHSGTLPLNANTIPELPEGVRMEYNAKNVEAYEKNNPKWLEDSFGDLYTNPPYTNPQFNTLLSNDSGFPSLSDDHCSDSVSRTVRISHDSSTPGKNIDLSIGNKFKAENGVSHERNKPTDDGISCFTISNVYNETEYQQRSSIADGTSLIPPDSESKIDCEKLSTAMNQINGNNTVPRYLHSFSNTDFGLDNQAIDINDFQASIIPPDNPLDINVESISCALAGINNNSHCTLMKGLARHVLQECDNGYFESEFDSVSI